MDVYLDFNVYISILKREVTQEINYEYVFSKLRWLRRHRPDIKFPYSPAHMEEVAVNLIKGDEARTLISKRLRTIEFFSRCYEYLPGLPSREDIIENLRVIPDLPELEKTRSSLTELLNEYNNGIEPVCHSTIKCTERPIACFSRVIGDLDATDWAHFNDVYHLGRRNESSLKSNFDQIGVSHEDIENFESYQKKRKLGPKLLSSVDSSKIFELDNVKEALAENLKEDDLTKILKGRDLLSNHGALETTVTIILNFLEKIGYNQEENNKLVKLRSRMHDVTHAIYGSQANYFVTNDHRFRKKLEAVYIFLEIPCKVISLDQFVSESFNEQKVLILNN